MGGIHELRRFWKATLLESSYNATAFVRSQYKTPCLFHLVHDPQLILVRFDKTDKKDMLYWVG